MIGNFKRDIQYGLRQLRRSPGFTVVIIFSLALGIGSAVTMFSAFRAVFLRPLPYKDPSQLVMLGKQYNHDRQGGMNLADLELIRTSSQSFSETASFSSFETETMSGGGIEPTTVWTRHVSENLFSLLGTKPLLGRGLGAGDIRQGSSAGVVLSYAIWQRNFHRDPHVIGRQVFFNGINCQIVGVMPRDFNFPQPGTGAWLPASDLVGDPRTKEVNIVARIAPGVTLSHARVSLEQLKPAMQAGDPGSGRDWAPTVERIAGRDSIEYRIAFELLLWAVALLLLIACLNVATLLLSRSAVREPEFALRAAIGAGRGRLIAQVLTESLLLAASGGVCGLLLAFAGNNLLRRSLPAGILVPRLSETHIDLQVLWVALALTVLTGFIFGVAPALQVSRKAVAESDKRARLGYHSKTRLRSFLALEVAFSFVLLFGSVLMTRSLLHIMGINPGFQTSHVLTVSVPPPKNVTDDSQKDRASYYSNLLEKVRGIPGVRFAAFTGSVPMGHIEISADLYIPNRSRFAYRVGYRAISSEYFDVLGIPLRAGRLLHPGGPQEDKGAILINETLAKQFWPGENPIGKKVSAEGPDSIPELTIVGVVGDTKHRTLTGEPVAEFYRSYQQHMGPSAGATIVLRTMGPANSVVSSLRREIHAVNSQQVIENLQTMQDSVSETVAGPRFYTLLIEVFGGLALMLTLVGVYGLASYSTGFRKREMAIRMALGAERPKLVVMIIRQGLTSVVAGLIIGLAGIMFVARFMESVIYGIQALDPVSVIFAAALISCGAAIGWYIPSRRSITVEPIEALRWE